MAARKKDDAEQAVEVTPRATAVEAGEPVEAPAYSQMGGTFAERAKAMQSAAAEDKSVSSGKTSRKSSKS